MKPLSWILLGISFAASSAGSLATATLVKGDFLNPGDGLLVTDTATQVKWLTPVYTSGHSYNDATVQSLISTYGFRYATGAETLSMINSNFNNPVVGPPGDAAGFASAMDFFNVFGIAEQVICAALPPPMTCPRTQGLTSDPGPSPGTHNAFGMIQANSDGYLIADNPWSDSSSDTQLGSWLVLVNQACGDGLVGGSEQCDLGASKGNAHGCCTVGCQYRTAGEICRPSTSGCDLAESCTGAGAACPADGAQGTTVAKPKVILKRLHTPVGDDGLTFKGKYTMGASVLSSLDPVSGGARVLIQDVTSATVVDANLPAGAYDSGTKTGWKANAAG